MHRYVVAKTLRATPILCCVVSFSPTTNKLTFFELSRIRHSSINFRESTKSSFPVRRVARCGGVPCQAVVSSTHIQTRAHSGRHEGASRPTASPSDPPTDGAGPGWEAAMDMWPLHRTPHFSRSQRLFTSWQHGLVASLGAAMGIGFVAFLLYAPVKEDTVHHTAVVASEALGDLRLKGRAVELSKEVVDNVLNDPKTLQLVVGIAVKLLAQEDTKIAISSLLRSLFEDHYTQEITKKFVLKILRDPWIMEQIHVIAKDHTLKIIETKEVKTALTKLFTECIERMVENSELQHSVARAIRVSLIRAINPLL